MVEIMDGRVCKCSVERVRYVLNNLLHLNLRNMESFHSYSLFHSPSARDNTDATHKISRHISH